MSDTKAELQQKYMNCLEGIDSVRSILDASNVFVSQLKKLDDDLASKSKVLSDILYSYSYKMTAM